MRVPRILGLILCAAFMMGNTKCASNRPAIETHFWFWHEESKAHRRCMSREGDECTFWDLIQPGSDRIKLYILTDDETIQNVDNVLNQCRDWGNN